MRSCAVCPSRSQVVKLPRTQLLVGERSLAGADMISPGDVQALIHAAVPAIADTYTAHAGPGDPLTRGGVLAAIFHEWRAAEPGALDREFGIYKPHVVTVLQARPAWQYALRWSDRDDATVDDLAVRLAKAARMSVNAELSKLGGGIPPNVHKKRVLQEHGRWGGVVAWSQAPDIADDSRRARRECGMVRLEEWLSEPVAQRRKHESLLASTRADDAEATPLAAVESGRCGDDSSTASETAVGAIRIDLETASEEAGPRQEPVKHVYYTMCSAVMTGSAASGVECWKWAKSKVKSKVKSNKCDNKQRQLVREAVSVSIPQFAISGRKVMEVDGVVYYIEMMTFKRLLCLHTEHSIGLVGVQCRMFDQEYMRRAMKDSMRGAVAAFTSDFRATIVAPGPKDNNEVILTGKGCGVMDATALPSGVVLPPWAAYHLAEQSTHNVLLMLRDVEYIGGKQNVPTSSMNGQTSVNNRLHPQIITHLAGLKRFRPPMQNGSSIAVWYRGIGPGHMCSVYFKEDGP